MELQITQLEEENTRLQSELKAERERWIGNINSIDENEWLHNNFLKRQERGCMDEEAFVFTLKEIKEELKQKHEVKNGTRN